MRFLTVNAQLGGLVKVPFINPRLSFLDLVKLIRSIRSTWLVYGPYTKQFESHLASYLGVEDVVATSSCTSALQLALLLEDIGTGDEVITTPLSWVATTNVILHSGATPVFCDIDPSTGLIDCGEIEKLITNKTRAILAVDIYGQMVDIIGISEICKQYGLVLIEDAAHSVEASRDGFSPGQVADYAAFSFHAAKNLTSGQGGALSVRSLLNGEKARVLRRDGVVNQPDGKRRMLMLGNKFDSTDFQSALLINQLKTINLKHKKRKKVFSRYVNGFSGTNIKFLEFVPNSVHASHLFVVLVAEEIRDNLREQLTFLGISTSVHYEAIHLEPFYRDLYGFDENFCPNAVAFGRSVISLPTYPSLTRRQQKYVIKKLLQCHSRISAN
jgi:dTDP-4-amino-4,6-dideoxygalactose transaminase